MLLNFLLILIPILFSAFPIIATIAVNKVNFLYNEEVSKVGFELKKRTWGPSFKETKKVAELSTNKYYRKKAHEAIFLWKISYGCLIVFAFLFVILGFLNS